MVNRHLLYSSAAASGSRGVAGGMAGGRAAGAAVAAARGIHRRRRHRRRGHRQERAGSRRLGDRRDDRARHPLREDGGDGRSGPLPDPRPAAGELQRVGARLRTRRLAQGQERARPHREPDRGAGAKRESRGGVLPRHLLVLDARHSGQEPVSRHGAQRERDAGRLPDAGTMVERRPVERLRQLPPARRQGHARDPRGTGRLRQLARCLAQAARVRTGRDQHDHLHFTNEHGGRRAHQAAGGVDRSDQGGRDPGVGTVAAARGRAQSRRDRVRLVVAQVLPPRPRPDRPAQAHGERLWPDLRGRRVEHG